MLLFSSLLFPPLLIFAVSPSLLRKAQLYIPVFRPVSASIITISDNRVNGEEVMEQCRDENGGQDQLLSAHSLLTIILGSRIQGNVNKEEDEFAGLSIEQINEEIAKEEAKNKAKKERAERQEAIARLRRLRAETQRPAAVDNIMVMHDPVPPMVRHRQIDPQEYQWDQGRGQLRGPTRETGDYDANCGRCGQALSGFDRFCTSCGQARVARTQPYYPVAASQAIPASPAPSDPAAAAPDPALLNQQLALRLKWEEMELDIARRYKLAQFEQITGKSPFEFSSPQEQYHQGERQFPSRQQPPLGRQSNRGRQATPFRGSGPIHRPRSLQWVAPALRQTSYVPMQRQGPREPRVAKRGQVARGVADLLGQQAQLSQQQQQQPQRDEEEGAAGEVSIKEEPQNAALDPPIKQERTERGDEHASDM
ncbi:MAG: hypothetical protein Q9192_003854 [Flavoplaca navasiana]